MRETCARVLAAALMTGAIATAMGLPTLFESDGNPGRRLTAPPSSLQRSVRSPLLTPGAHQNPAPQRSAPGPARERTTGDRAASSRVAQAVTRSDPRPAGAGKSPAAVPATPKPQPEPEPAPATQPETRGLASNPTPPAPTPEPEHGKKKPNGKKNGKAKSKAKPADRADPAEATPPPPADCEDPAPDVDQTAAEDAEHGHGKGGAEPQHGKKSKK